MPRLRIRRYINEGKRLSVDDCRALDLEAPLVNHDSKMTYAEVKPAPAAEYDPHNS